MRTDGHGCPGGLFPSPRSACAERLVEPAGAAAVIAALTSRLALTASVLRDGAWKLVPARELVEGDVVKLSLGGVVPADVKVTGGSVWLGRSMLTGESIPIEVGPGLQTWAGALVRRGEAIALVTANRTLAGIFMGIAELMLCVTVLLVGTYRMGG